MFLYESNIIILINKGILLKIMAELSEEEKQAEIDAIRKRHAGIKDRKKRRGSQISSKQPADKKHIVIHKRGEKSEEDLAQLKVIEDYRNECGKYIEEIVGSYAREGEVGKESAIALFQDMESRGISPSCITYYRGLYKKLAEEAEGTWSVDLSKALQPEKPELTPEQKKRMRKSTIQIKLPPHMQE